LTGGRLHATDVTNASRTMLFDLHRLAWDEELLDGFGIPSALLPELRDTGDDFGTTVPELFGDAIPITGVAGDQQAALIGQACFRPGMVKSTYGTGAFALVHTGAAPAVSRHRLLTTVAYRLGGETAYALEGSIFVAGAAVQWLRDRLGAIAAAPESAALAADAGLAIDSLRVDGGMAVSDWTLQFLADILPAVIERPASVETTAWGAAYAAGLTRGICPEPAAMMAGWSAARRFTPAMPAAE